MTKYTKVTCRICQNYKDTVFKNLTLSEMDKLSSSKKIISFKKGEVIIEEGQNPKGVYCIKSGKLKLFTRGFNGKEQILRIIKEGDIIGYRSLLSEQSFSASAVALEDIITCFIPEIYFKKILNQNHLLNGGMMKVAMQELGVAGKQITSLAQKTVRERLAYEIILLENKLGTDKNGFINISLTRTEIANIIGTATESVIRLISEFKNDNLIEVEGRKLKILNKDQLNKINTF